MKRTLFTAVILTCFFAHLQAQILAPVKWSYAAKDIGHNEAMLFIKATIEPGWHLYSQYIKDGGPVKTSFAFSPNGGYKLIGKPFEPKAISKFEKVFGIEVGYFENSVVFQQKIKVSKKRLVVKGNLEYMVCNDKQCLPPDNIAFTIPVK
jgi:hypothetical protein